MNGFFPRVFERYNFFLLKSTRLLFNMSIIPSSLVNMYVFCSVALSPLLILLNFYNVLQRIIEILVLRSIAYFYSTIC